MLQRPSRSVQRLYYYSSRAQSGEYHRTTPPATTLAEAVKGVCRRVRVLSLTRYPAMETICSGLRSVGTSTPCSPTKIMSSRRTPPQPGI